MGTMEEKWENTWRSGCTWTLALFPDLDRIFSSSNTRRAVPAAQVKYPTAMSTMHYSSPSPLRPFLAVPSKTRGHENGDTIAGLDGLLELVGHVVAPIPTKFDKERERIGDCA